MRAFALPALLASAVFFIGSPLCASAASAQPAPAAAAADADATPAYDKFVKDAERRDGLFPIVRKDGKVYLEIGKDQLDKDFLEHATSANGLGGFFVLSGDDFQQQARVVHFTLVNEKTAAVVWPQTRFAARPGTALAEAVKGSSADSVQALAPVVASDKASGKIVIDASFLLADNLDLGATINAAIDNPEKPNPEGAYRLDPSRTYFGAAKAFPKNDVIEVDQTFASAKPDTIDTVTDPRSIQMRVKYNFAEILSTPDYMPRLVDDRVGYWNMTRVAFDRSDTLDTNVRYITRRNIQATDPTRPSPAKHPVVYTLTNTIPEQYRPAIRDALLEWNKAFEKIGILGAIQVQDQPNDPAFDPDDIRYNTIRWLTEANGGGFAEAQIEWDPRTGEIFRSGVLIDSDMMRFTQPVYGEAIPLAHARVGDPAASPPLDAALDPALWDPAKIEPPANPNRATSGVGLHLDTGALRQAQAGALVLQAYGGALPPNFDYDFLKSIVLHEAGHDFGLAHNFIGHEAFSMGEVQDKAFTTSNGVASSVMEYAPINLSPKGTKQGAYWQTTLGPYDYHVIHWGYAPVPGATTPEAEVPTLDKWAAAAVDPKYRFASDEDVAWNGHAIDPRVVQWTLTNQPLRWCESQLGMYRSVLGTLDSRLPQTQRTWEQSRFAFTVILAEYGRCAGSMTHWIAGEYLHRGRPGDPGVRDALTPVARADQQRAFHDLDTYLFAESAFSVSPATLDRTVYAEYEPIDNYGYNPPARHDVSLSALAGTYQARALAYMFSPLVLQRLDDMQLKAKAGATMSVADLFAWTQTSVFGDVQRGAAPKGPVRRNLQRMYARLLEKIAVAPWPGTPPDAQALARLELTSLAADLRKSLAARGLDLQTRAHFAALQSEVNRALDAHGVIPIN
jgi:hypothetical protein